MSDLLQRPIIEHIPGAVLSDNIEELINTTEPTQTTNDVAIVQRLLQHLDLINEFKDKIDAIDYLSDNAAKLAESPVFDTDNQDILNAIVALGYSGNSVTFEMFKDAIDLVIEGYKNLALISMTGVAND